MGWQRLSHPILRFAIVGCLNTSIDLGLFLLLTHLFPGHTAPCNVVSYTAGLLNSFALNRFWTFGETARRGRTGRQFALFATFNLLGLFISTTMVVTLSWLVPVELAKMTSVPVVFAWGYWTNRRLVYAARPAGALLGVMARGLKCMQGNRVT